MIQIQIAAIDADRRDKNYESEDWSPYLTGETAQEALNNLVEIINDDDFACVNHFYRVVDTERKEVL